MRLGVYTDYVYRRDADGMVYADRAFALFLAEVGRSFDDLVLFGRLSPSAGTAHYPVGDAVRFIALPHYPSVTAVAQALGAWRRSARIFSRELASLDVVWLLGPHPLGFAFAALAGLRATPVVLGVRQDMPAYVRSRHPGRRGVQALADVLEGTNRLLARRCPVVVVGDDLARRYGRAPRLLTIAVSLVRQTDVRVVTDLGRERYGNELRVLSVGRLETEKNPLLLAEILAVLRRASTRWRLVVCGEGPEEWALRDRLSELGVGDACELRGYVPLTAGLLDVYRDAHVFLHVSLTEGLPQVLLEAFAAGLPVVATRVGGVQAAAGEAALLVPPSDAQAAAAAVARIAEDLPLRVRMVERGLKHARQHTLEIESARVAMFIRSVAAPGETDGTIPPGPE